MNGKELRVEIVGYGSPRGWSITWFPPLPVRGGGFRNGIGGDAKGWPDLCLCRDRLLFAELKGDKDRVRDVSQTEWISRLRLAGIEAYIWTPEHWYDGTIRAILDRRGPPPSGPVGNVQLPLHARG